MIRHWTGLSIPYDYTTADLISYASYATVQAVVRESELLYECVQSFRLEYLRSGLGEFTHVWQNPGILTKANRIWHVPRVSQY